MWAVKLKAHDPLDRFADTVVLPADELAARRQRKHTGQLTQPQLQRLMTAAALREKSERDE